MKKLLYFIMLFSLLNGAEVNFVISEPILGKSVNPIIKETIYKGFNRQIWDFTSRVKDAGADLAIKYLVSDMDLNTVVVDNKQIKDYLKADLKVAVELKSFIAKVNQSFSSKASNISLNLNNSFNKKFKFSLKKSVLKKMSKETLKENDYNAQFETKLRLMKMDYRCEDDEICMPFYKLYYPRPNIIGYKDMELLKPNLFFFEYFVPHKEGRRYFLNITVYVVTIDSDGKPTFEYELIKDFDWRRNFRFIAAQSSTTIREIITNKTEWDIK